MSQVNRAQMVIGLAALLLGTVVYLVDRPPGQLFVHSAISLFQFTPAVFGFVGHSLPTFAHVFAFILLTAGLCAGVKKVYLTVCLSWFFVDSAFELGQHPQVAKWLSTLIPPWFEKIPILDRTDSYFLHGAFDTLDMLSIALGTLAAYIVIQRTQLRRANHE